MASRKPSKSSQRPPKDAMLTAASLDRPSSSLLVPQAAKISDIAARARLLELGCCPEVQEVSKSGAPHQAITAASGLLC